MFAPSLPNYFINKYSVVNDTVMDNFSGRGTTALVSREMSRNFVGTDLNPYALALSKFKVGTCKKKKLLKKIYELEIEFKNSQFIYETKINDYEEMQIYYSNKTLSQLIFLREKIGKK
jgi:DNA modification methylase